MTVSFCTDEHVPSVFITALRSNGYTVTKAKEVLGAGTDDRHLLEYCGTNGDILITHDKKDFGGTVGKAVDHVGIVIYTDPLFLRTEPEQAVRTIEQVLDQYPPTELENERIWLDQWRK